MPPTAPVGRRGLLRLALTGGAALVGTAVAPAAPAAAGPAVPLPRSKGRPGLRTPGPVAPSAPTAPTASATAGPDVPLSTGVKPGTRPITRLAGGTGRLPDDEAFRLHLLRRVTYGVTPELLNDVAALGTQGWLERQLDPASLPDPVADAYVARLPLSRATAPEVWAQTPGGSWEATLQVQQAAIARRTWSTRQLFEVLVEFWSDHLNITCPGGEAWAHKGTDDLEVVRRHALGRFEDMLAASVTSPAMMLYLDNAESRGSAPNENYARELLELHTVGVDAGYTRDDILAVARAVSGLSVWNPWNGGTAANLGLLRYRSDWHWTGPLQVLGWSSPNADRAGGVAVAQSLVRHLARHPATARRICRKLCVRLVSDDPPAALVERLAQVYLDGGTAVVPVLRALLASPEFAASVGQKVRRPAEDVIATVRAVGTAPDPASTATGGVATWNWALGDVGHSPMGWHPPNGYPDVAAAWAGTGTRLGVWNLHVAMTSGWWKEGLVQPALTTRLLPAVRPTTREGLVDALCARLLPGHDVLPAHRAALVGLLGTGGPVRDGDTTWMFAPLVAAVLDSPYWSVR